MSHMLEMEEGTTQTPPLLQFRHDFPIPKYYLIQILFRNGEIVPAL